MRSVFLAVIGLGLTASGCSQGGDDNDWHEGGYPGDGLGPGGGTGGAEGGDSGDDNDGGGDSGDGGGGLDTESPSADYGPANSWSHATEDDIPVGLQGTGWGIGDVANNFTLQDQYGDEVELYQFYGKVIVLDIFAEW